MGAAKLRTNEAKVKKVSPYPIAVVVAGVSGKILKLETSGFLMLTEGILRVGQIVKDSIELPVMKKTVEYTGWVVKTYDHAPSKEKGKETKWRLAEVSFKNISEKDKNQILAYLRKIGQS